MSAIEDKQQAFSGTKICNWRADEIVKSLEFRKEYAARPNVIPAEEMPWERSPDGLIKHLIHRNMNTPELMWANPPPEVSRISRASCCPQMSATCW